MAATISKPAPAPAAGPRYGRTRDAFGGLFTSLAILVAVLSLMAFFFSVAALRAESTLSQNDLSAFTRNIGAQISQVDPSANNPLAEGAVQKALQNSSTVQQLSKSASQGSQSLNQQLALLDPALKATLSKNPVQLNTGNNFIASAQQYLQNGAIWGAIAASSLALLALLVSTRRDKVLRRIGRWAIMVSIFAVLAGWVLPWFISTHLQGVLASLASWYSNGQSSAHVVYLTLLAFGVFAFTAGSILKPRAKSV